MKINNLRKENRNNIVQAVATVVWEDNDRPSKEVYFGTDEEFGKDLSCNPHSFLAACILPAFRHGEKRIFIDEKICPEFHEGLNIVMGWIRQWYYEPDRKFVSIEAKADPYMPKIRREGRAVSLFSGGIDSLATLRANRLRFPLDHPSSIKDCLLIGGMNIESDNQQSTFKAAFKALNEVALDANVILLPMYTNVRSLEEDTNFFVDCWQSGIISAAVHSFAGRFSEVYIASSDDIPNMHPLGSHPLLDPFYGCSDLLIKHDGITLSRLDKTKLVADWDAALQNIKVCPPNWPGENCGKCEKCARTMLALLIVDALHKSDSFPEDDISEEFLMTAVNFWKWHYHYEELLTPLKEMGREDLSHVIETKMEEYQKNANKKNKLSVKIRKYFKEIDENYFDSGIVNFKRKFFLK